MPRKSLMSSRLWQHLIQTNVSALKNFQRLPDLSNIKVYTLTCHRPIGRRCIQSLSNQVLTLPQCINVARVNHGTYTRQFTEKIGVVYLTSSTTPD